MLNRVLPWRGAAGETCFRNAPATLGRDAPTSVYRRMRGRRTVPDRFVAFGGQQSGGVRSRRPSCRGCCDVTRYVAPPWGVLCSSPLRTAKRCNSLGLMSEVGRPGCPRKLAPRRQSLTLLWWARRLLPRRDQVRRAVAVTGRLRAPWPLPAAVAWHATTEQRGRDRCGRPCGCRACCCRVVPAGGAAGSHDGL